MFNEFQLPGGTWAECSKDIDEYLKRSGSAMASDYSGEFLKNRRFCKKIIRLYQKTEPESMISKIFRNM